MDASRRSVSYCGVTCNPESFDDIWVGPTMSRRPRLAGDGRVLLPETVKYDRDSHFLRARLSERESDPFDWTADRLLLAESFARLDLEDLPVAYAWLERHGCVDRVDFHGGSAEVPDADWLVTRRPGDLADHLDEVLLEQDNVLWHLTTLARLSERRSTKEWDPSWGRLVIGSPEGGLIIGGPDAGEELKSRRYIEHLRKSRIPEVDRPFVEEQDRLYAAVEGLAVVIVSEPGWLGFWRTEHTELGPRVPDEAREKARMLGSTWDQGVELERILIIPYVAQAVERRFTVERELREVDGVTRSVLVPREERVWQSILAPIYLQLFEALRRITEGEPGAATCRECGRPFLVLDARRRFFCNDRERYRHAQRDRRKRMAVHDSGTGTDSLTVEIVREGVEQ